MAEEDEDNPIAELLGSFVKTWFKIRRIDRVMNFEIARYTTLSIAVASAWVGISWGLLVAYMVGKETIDDWLLALLVILVIATNVSLMYLTPRAIDGLSRKIMLASDAAIAKAIAEEFPTEASETTSILLPSSSPPSSESGPSPRKSP